MKNNRLSILIGLVVTIAALAFAVLKFGSSVGWGPITEEEPKKGNESSALTETDSPQEPASKSVTLRAVGDNLIHFCIYDQAAKRSTDGTYDFSYAYSGVEEPIKTADIAMINQETIINDAAAPSSYPLFNSPTQLGDQMVNMGFDVVTMANNHVLDQGYEGALKAIDYWHSKGIINLGAYKNQNDMNTVRVQEVNGIKFSYVAITSYLNGLSINPDQSDLKVVSLTDPYQSTEQVYENAKKMIEAANEVADVVVVSMHWRQENVTDVPQGQIDFANYLVECGADVIIGSGPHVLQPLSWIDKPDGSGQALCIYSLGNFISGQDSPANLLSAIADLTFERNASGGIDITNVGMIPIITHYEKNYANLKLYLFEDYTEELGKTHGATGMSYQYAKDFYNKVIGEQYLRSYKY